MKITIEYHVGESFFLVFESNKLYSEQEHDDRDLGYAIVVGRNA